jgi:aspartyl protease family protein
MQEFPRTLKIATVWLVLGAVLFLGFQFLERERRRTSFSVDEAGTIEIRRGPDGHYHWPGSINGRPVDFLIDTGATGTAISSAMADELGLERLGPITSHTAGGVVTGSRVRGDLVLQGGITVERLRMVALPALGDRPLLGMDVLGRLRWQQHQGGLRIELGSSASGR